MGTDRALCPKNDFSIQGRSPHETAGQPKSFDAAFSDGAIAPSVSPNQRPTIRPDEQDRVLLEQIIARKEWECSKNWKSSQLFASLAYFNISASRCDVETP